VSGADPTGSGAAGGLVLAIDQGTHSSRALVFDRGGGVVGRGEREISLARPRPDWAEQDGEEIVESVHAAVAQAAAELGPRAADLAAAGLSSQRASCVCWDRASGRPLSPVFSWQDRRMHAWIEALAAHGDDVHRRTGLFLSPHYGASKLRWALDHLPQVARALDDGRLAWGPLASFLAFRLLKERPLLADPQCAARTQLWNLQARDWDPELLRLFGLPAGCLPASAPTCRHWGTLAVAGIGVPLTAVNGDQSAAVFAFGWPEAESAYVNIGTSAFVQRALMQAPGQVPRQLTGIILADGATTVYMVEGNVNGAGAGLEWLSAQPGFDDLVEQLPRWLGRPAPPLLFLNGIAGLGGPFWQARFDSRFVGDDGEPWARAVALVESIAFLLQANVEHMAPYVPALSRIRVSGGVSRLDGLCRRLASLNGVAVHRRDDPEASARGIAYLAAGRPAQWNAGVAEEVFEPQADPALRRRYRRWRALMAEATGV
jgi:glycerol kinase